MKKILMVLSLTSIVACKEITYVKEPALSNNTKTDTVFVGLQDVKIRIDWAKFNSSNITNDVMVDAVSDNGYHITHVGARLVYPINNAAFSQSTVRDTSDSRLITMQVPATDTAHLYVLAVFDSANVRKALKMGVKRNISIPPSGSVLLTLDSLTLLDTDWVVDSMSDTTIRAVMENDTIRVTHNIITVNPVIRVSVVDPYQIGTQFIAYSNRIVKFYGSGFEYGNTTGWRNFGISVPYRGTQTSVEKFWPYIDGAFFNLNGAYLVGKQGIVKTTWQ
jgi:hypothetical protein